MEVYRRSSWLLLLLGVSLLAATLQGVQGEAESEGPSESECRPYIEKALKELETGEVSPNVGTDSSKEDVPTVEITTDDSDQGEDDTPDNKEDKDVEDGDGGDKSGEAESAEAQSVEDTQEAASAEGTETDKSEESKPDTDGESQEDAASTASVEDNSEEKAEGETQETEEEKSTEAQAESVEQKDEAQESVEEEGKDETKEESVEEESAQKEDAQADEAQESVEGEKESVEETKEEQAEGDKESVEDTKEDTKESTEDTKEDTKESTEETAETKESLEEEAKTEESKDEQQKETEESKEEEKTESVEDANTTEESHEGTKAAESAESAEEEAQVKVEVESKEDAAKLDESSEAGEGETTEESKEEGSPVEEELSLDVEIPTNLRPRDYVEQLLKLDEQSSEVEQIIDRVSEITLRELKKLYENAIKPLETLYKYRDLSNRHFGDAEIYSKPLILFMGPWSGGKSSIINYLIDNEYNETSLRTGAEPSPAYFNILMYGEEPEILDGTQLVADFTFSGLQKFGQGLEERLRGYKLPSKLLEKVNIVEIPGILEVRKQVSRVFPFNDACQWFIDRADIIFLVYDPSKLDVGPETEAILDQLKGREHQTRIVLNKADQVKPEELMRVQGALIWNISPLMSSAQPPVMYTVSLWSRPFENWAPVRLLQAQERAFLRDLRTAIDKRIDNKIASARRFAVRVRNHAKMVDCYLTTYYNHKSVFGNRKQVADQIIEHPQDYHIYEGLSTLTNISRYDLPDPEVYKDFFKLNPLYEFQQLSATCTYFRGCPINRLDVAIAYDLPELIGKHKRLVEAALAEANPGTS